MTQIQKSDIKGREFLFTQYVTDNRKDSDDELILVKEKIHTNDGRIIKNLLKLQNFKRKVHITKPGHRNHKQKKEWEDVKKLDSFTTTQSTMAKSICRAINRPGANLSMKQLNRSPYVYGTDIASTVMVKQMYQETWGEECNSAATKAVLDLEMDVNGDAISEEAHARIAKCRKRLERIIHDIRSSRSKKERRDLEFQRAAVEKEIKGLSEPIISGSLTYGDKVLLAINSNFLKKNDLTEGRIRKAADKYIGQYLKDRNIELTIEFCVDDARVTTTLLDYAHKWSPDFILIWNMSFDIPKMVESLELQGIDPKYVFSDPSIENRYKSFRWKEGASQKTTASGKVMSIHPADRWHTVFAPASFYFLDAMCCYKRLRVTEGNQPSYSLDAILDKDLKLSKLKFTEADAYSGLEWHKFMQRNYKVEYMIYNIFDCIGVELLDEKNDDVNSIRLNAGISDLDRFTSTPRRLCDDLHFEVEKRGLVIGSTSDEMVQEIDDPVFSMKDWIVTLPSHLTNVEGLKILAEIPELATKVFACVGDLDVTGAYPTTEDIENISKETTMRELCAIFGLTEYETRRVCLNMTSPKTNALWIANTVLGAPNLDEMLNSFVRTLPAASNDVVLSSDVDIAA